VAQGVELLTSKFDALSSTPSSTEKIKDINDKLKSQNEIRIVKNLQKYKIQP
jgi:hypothetical protein